MLLAHADAGSVGIIAIPLLILDLAVHAGNVIVLVEWFKARAHGRKAKLPACGCKRN